MIQDLCTPAVLYIVYSITQVISKIMKGNYSAALIEMVLSSIFALFLNYLCTINMEIVAWTIIFIPFLLMSVIIALLLYLFGRDPETGRILFNQYDESKNTPDDTSFDIREITNSLVDSTTNLFKMDNTESNDTENKIQTQSGKSGSVAATASNVDDNTTPHTTTSNNVSQMRVPFKSGEGYYTIPIENIITHNKKNYYVGKQVKTCVVIYEDKSTYEKTENTQTEGFETLTTSATPYLYFGSAESFVDDKSLVNIGNKQITMYVNKQTIKHTLEIKLNNVRVHSTDIGITRTISTDTQNIYITEIDFVFAATPEMFVNNTLFYIGSTPEFSSKIQNNQIIMLDTHVSLS